MRIESVECHLALSIHCCDCTSEGAGLWTVYKYTLGEHPEFFRATITEVYVSVIACSAQA